MCLSEKRDPGLPQSGKQFRGRGTFMRKCHLAGCSAEEEKRERTEEQKSGCFSHTSSYPLTEAGTPNKLCLTYVAGST